MNGKPEPIPLTDTEKKAVVVFTKANKLVVEIPKFEFPDFPGKEHLCLHSIRIRIENIVILNSIEDEPTMSREYAINEIRKFLQLVLSLGEWASRSIELSVGKKAEGVTKIVPTSSLSKNLSPSEKSPENCMLTQNLIDWIAKELETRLEVSTKDYFLRIGVTSAASIQKQNETS